MFEAVCTDRIQQFDDEESDEEEDEDEDSGAWADKDAGLSSPMDHRNNRWVCPLLPLAVSWNEGWRGEVVRVVCFNWN